MQPKRPLNPQFARRPALDGMIRPTVTPLKPQPLRPQPQQLVRSQARRPQLKSLKKQTIGGYVQIAFVVVGALAISLMAQTLPLGEIAVIAYGVIALLRRVPATRSFVLSFITLVICGLCVVIGARFLAEHFAAYTFLLLIISLLSVVRETKYLAKVEKSAVNNTQA